MSIASPNLDLTSTFMVMSMMPVAHCMVSLWQLSHIVSQYSSHSFMPRHCFSSHSKCASSVLAILLMVCSSCVTSQACCLIVHSIRFLQSPSVLTESEVLLLSHFPFLFNSYSMLATMKFMHVILTDMVPGVPLASPVSPMAIVLSIGSFWSFFQ